MHRTHGILALLCLGILGIAAAPRLRAASRDAGAEHRRVASLSRSLVPVEAPQPLTLPTLRSERDEPFGAERLRGRWSVLFFGFTSCPDVCPTTLQLLTRVALVANTRVTDGSTQLLFVTVDPATDTPTRLREHLAHFDPRIRGLTGSDGDVTQFSDAVGAAARVTGSGIDHSTSLFVIDPDGRLAGLLLNPSDPVQIVADLDSLNARYVAAGSTGR